MPPKNGGYSSSWERLTEAQSYILVYLKFPREAYLYRTCFGGGVLLEVLLTCDSLSCGAVNGERDLTLIRKGFHERISRQTFFTENENIIDKAVHLRNAAF
jgi:hypothetical protein